MAEKAAFAARLACFCEMARAALAKPLGRLYGILESEAPAGIDARSVKGEKEGEFPLLANQGCIA